MASGAERERFALLPPAFAHTYTMENDPPAILLTTPKFEGRSLTSTGHFLSAFPRLAQPHTPRLHQLPMRDPTDRFDLPDHLTWQMNMGVEHNALSRDAQGILGETFIPTRDADGMPIMAGMEAIRGHQEDCESSPRSFVVGTETTN